MVDGVTKFFYCIAKDYMNFISVYYFEFINAIPDKLKQIRNLILSAFPMKNEIPQSPFDDEVWVDTNKEMRLFPEFWSDALIEQLVYNLPTLKNDIKTGNSKAIANYFENSEGVIGDVKTKNQKLIHAIIIMISKEIHGIEVSKLQQKIKENELLKDIAL